MTPGKTGNIAVAVFGALLILAGLAQGAGGAVLLKAGGSAFYLISGAALFASGALLFKRRREGLALLGLILAGAVLWSIAETGLSPFGLASRAGYFFALLVAAMCFLSATERTFFTGAGYRNSLTIFPALSLAFAVLIAGAAVLSSFPLVEGGRPDPAPAVAEEPSRYVDWPHYGGSLSGQRYSGLADITAANVEGLELAWFYRTGGQDRLGSNSRFTATPLKVGETLYFCTPNNIVIALDAASGEEKWRFDSEPDADAAFSVVCRGVSFSRTDSAECPERILFGTLDARLIALDAHSGRKCAGFGENGEVDLAIDRNSPYAGYYFLSSPPTIVDGLAILGGYVLDNQTLDAPTGLVRAYDVETGALRWTWDAGRGAVAGADPGAPTPGNPNAWAVFSADPALGLVYVPTGNSAHDIYGGMRTQAAEDYSSSIVALEVATGAPAWRFQAVRHDVWDYDMPAQPVLLDVTIDGVKTPALLAPSKSGEVFLLDRRTGAPLAPVEDAPAPQGGVAGERLSPTQPDAPGYLSFDPPRLQESSMWGVTPFDALACRIAFRKARYEGRFTPPSLEGSISYPGTIGALNWGSVSVDPVNEVMLVNTSWMPSVLELEPRVEANRRGVKPIVPGRSGPVLDKDGSVLMAQEGAPYAVRFKMALLSPLGFPCHAPPWGKLFAVDLRNQSVIWSQPFGTTEDVAPLGAALPLGTFNIGGALTTAGGIAFISATTDSRLRAYDLATGETLWSYKLPAGGQATPMTYRTGDGRQMIVIVAGGHGSLGTPRGDFVLAFSLPE